MRNPAWLAEVVAMVGVGAADGARYCLRRTGRDFCRGIVSLSRCLVQSLALLELKAIRGVRYLGRCPRKRFLASGEARRRIWWDRLRRQLQVGKERDRLYVVQVWGNHEM